MSAPKDIIKKLKQRYRFVRAIEIVLTAGSMATLFYAVVPILSGSDALAWPMAAGAFFILSVAFFFTHQLHTLQDADLVRYLNQRYSSLEHSADLLLRSTDELGLLEQLQRERTLRILEKLYPEIDIPHHLQRAGLMFAISILASSLMSFYLSPKAKLSSSVSDISEVTTTKLLPALVSSAQVTITPPAYTGLQPFSSSGFDIKLPEGSRAQWFVSFSDSVEHAQLIFSGSDSLALRSNTTKIIQVSGFYQLQWQTQKRVQRSDYFKIEVVPDLAPKITMSNLGQFTNLKISDAPTIKVASTIQDDYRLTDAFIIATVSKGSGESVKFREEKIKFATPGVIGGKQVQAEQVLNIKSLGLEPGDELYFYIEAMDNKFPVANRSRTETYFVALEDTTRLEAVDDEGLGVDLMPDYFRSQRQIIIDTEKLLKDKKKMAKNLFNATSNELGFDQKALRLKYGEFLGEEAESGIGVEAAHPDEDHDEEEDPTKKFGHQHDTDNEHNLVAEKKDGHQHTKNTDDPDAKEDPLAAFAHNHDDGEVATFFILSIRAKLKAALTVMWDAELHLRLYQPEKSLPYQYTALRLLKEISNDSRIYVHRSGFDPPPLKEEKRLSADLTDVYSPTKNVAVADEPALPALTQTYRVLESRLVSENFALSPSEQQLFQRAGQEYASFALQDPSLLSGLSLLKQFSENAFAKTGGSSEARVLRAQLSKVMPSLSASPSRQSQSRHTVDDLFLRHLKKSSHE